ncbi:MAG: SUMF1/EgtB/PvdO family nonheme iron enzyme [Polyangiaceae bacterium]|nr:SUMF1/EgtB/PvdO family nonheme iron enzyme [Polyangiaceae bacterium]
MKRASSKAQSSIVVRRGLPIVAAFATLIGASAGAFGAGCVAVLGDFGDKEVPELDGGADGATGGGMGGMGGEGGGTGGEGGAGTGGIGGMGGAGMGGEGGGAGGGSQAICPATGKGPSMVLVAGPAGDNYCVDATEVSVGQYDAWLSGSPSVDGQAPECDAWNTTFQPSTSSTNFCNVYNYTDHRVNSPKRPVRCVDWCDAAAFCKWSGKRLCGTIGGGAGAFVKPTDPDVSEWFRACSEAGMRDYSYGDAYDKKACIGADYEGNSMFEPGVDFPRDVGSTATCEGGYTGLFDMSGNVGEWEGSCNGSNGNGDACHVRGGSYFEIDANLMCSSNVAPTRDTTAISIGIRCCADPL